MSLHILRLKCANITLKRVLKLLLLRYLFVLHNGMLCAILNNKGNIKYIIALFKFPAIFHIRFIQNSICKT